jgi:hypothetical protein
MLYTLSLYPTPTHKNAQKCNSIKNLNKSIYMYNAHNIVRYKMEHPSKSKTNLIASFAEIWTT